MWYFLEISKMLAILSVVLALNAFYINLKNFTFRNPTHGKKCSKESVEENVASTSTKKKKKKYKRISKKEIVNEQLEIRRCSIDERLNLKMYKVREEENQKQVEMLKKKVEELLMEVRRKEETISKMLRKEDLRNMKYLNEDEILDKKQKVKMKLTADRKKYLEDLKAEEEINREYREKKALEEEKRINDVVNEVKRILSVENLIDQQMLKDQENSCKIRDSITEKAKEKCFPSLIGLSTNGRKGIWKKGNHRVTEKLINEEHERKRQNSDYESEQLDGVIKLEARLKAVLTSSEWQYHYDVFQQWLKDRQPCLLDKIMDDMHKYGVLKGKELDMYKFLRRYDICMETFFDFTNLDFSSAEETDLPGPVIRGNTSVPVTESYTDKTAYRMCIGDRQPFGDSHTLTYKNHRSSKYACTITV